MLFKKYGGLVRPHFYQVMGKKMDVSSYLLPSVC